MGHCHTKVDSVDQVYQTVPQQDLHAQNAGVKVQDNSTLHPTMPTQNVTVDTQDHETNVRESSARVPALSTDIHGSCEGTSIGHTVT